MKKINRISYIIITSIIFIIFISLINVSSETKEHEGVCKYLMGLFKRKNYTEENLQKVHIILNSNLSSEDLSNMIDIIGRLRKKEIELNKIYSLLPLLHHDNSKETFLALSLIGGHIEKKKLPSERIVNLLTMLDYDISNKEFSKMTYLAKSGISPSQFELHLKHFKNLPTINPTVRNPGVISKRYGVTIDNKKRVFNNGTIIMLPRKSIITATAPGTITHVGKYSHKYCLKDYPCYAKAVVIQHQYGYKTVYINLSNITVSKNQKVRKGQTIGYVNKNKFQNKYYLRYLVFIGTEPVDPGL